MTGKRGRAGAGQDCRVRDRRRSSALIIFLAYRLIDDLALLRRMAFQLKKRSRDPSRQVIVYLLRCHQSHV